MQSDSGPSSAKHLNCPDFELEIDLGSGQEYPKMKCQWRLNAVEVEEVQLMKSSAPVPDAPPPMSPEPLSEHPSSPPSVPASEQPSSPPPAATANKSLLQPLPKDVDAGMVEVCAALTGIAAAIAAILLDTAGMTENIRVFVAVWAGTLAVLSAYSALWLLAVYLKLGDSLLGFKEILELLKSPAKLRPYWLMALSLLIWLAGTLHECRTLTI